MTPSELAIMQGRLDRLQDINSNYYDHNHHEFVTHDHATPVRAECVAYGLALMEACGFEAIPIPVTVPTGKGGLQLDWHNANYEIEIIIHGDKKGTARKVDYMNCEWEVRYLTCPIKELAYWLMSY